MVGSEDGTGDGRVEWARGLAAELRRLDPRQASAVILVYVRRVSFDEAAHTLGLTADEFVATLSDAMGNLGRLLSGPGTAPA